MQIFHPESRPITILLLLIQPLNIIFYKNLLFLPKATLRSTYLLLKPLLSKLLTRPLPTKRIRVQLKDCELMTLCHCFFFFQPITARLFPIHSGSFSCALCSDDSSRQVSDQGPRLFGATILLRTFSEPPIWSPPLFGSMPFSAQIFLAKFRSLTVQLFILFLCFFFSFRATIK